MKEEIVFEKVIEALLNQNYQIDPNAYNPDLIRNADDPLARKILLGMDITTKILTIIGPCYDLPFDESFMKIKYIFKEEEFQKDIRKIYPLTNYVFYKFFLAQPIILALINADLLESDDYQRIWQQYDESVLSFRKYTGKIAGTKLSVTGLLFFIFSKKDKAETFRSQYMDKYKKFHLWKQTWIIPWGIDIANQTIIKHNGLPILTSSIIDLEKLKRDVFGE